MTRIYSYDEVRKIIIDFIEKASYCTIEVRHGDYNIIFKLNDGRKIALAIDFYYLDEKDEEIRNVIERCRKRGVKKESQNETTAVTTESLAL